MEFTAANSNSNFFKQIYVPLPNITAMDKYEFQYFS